MRVMQFNITMEHVLEKLISTEYHFLCEHWYGNITSLTPAFGRNNARVKEG